VWAQAPRTIRIVVPFPPGGSADILARLLGEQINKSQGPTVLIENRPGAGASIAYEFVARAPPDGNTLVINANSIVINPLLRKVGYDPLTSFEPICYLVSSPQVIVVNSASPYRTLADFVAAAHAEPGELTVATVGPATTQHIGFEQFKRLANLNVTYVPYSGGAPAITALLGEHVSGVLGNYSEAVEQLNAGKLRALAATSRTRIASLPDVRLSRRPATNLMRLKSGSAWLPRRRRRRKRSRSSPPGSPRQCKPQRSSRSSSILVSIRPEPAARILPNISANKTSNTAASFARRTSGRSEAAWLLWVMRLPQH
jgi:hypothetical protein